MNRKLKYALWAIVPVYILLMIYICMCIPIDADYSNIVLESNDILHGNIFLSDWNQTGISFVTTDILFFIIGSVIGGVSATSYYIGIGLMIATMVLLGFLLIEPSRRKWQDYVIFATLCALPCGFAISVLRAHTGSICWVLLSVWLINRELQKHEKKNLIITLIALTLGCMGDSVALIMGVIPIFLYCIVDFVSKNSDESKRPAKRNVAIVTGSAVVLSFVCDKLYYLIGGANKNDFLGSKMFEEIDKWIPKFITYIKSIFLIGDASFFGENLIKADTLGYFLNAVVIVVGFILIFRNCAKFVKGTDNDFISTVLSLGIVVISIVFIITDVAVDVHSSRYLAYITVVFAVLLVRDREWLSECTRFSKSAVSFLIVGAGIVILLFRTVDLLQLSREPASYAKLGEFLESNGLEQGYAAFWNASSTTVSSNNKVKVRAIENYGGTGSRFGMKNWFCKNSWYEEPANFVIVSEGDLFGVTPDNVRSYFGEPSNILEYGNMQIFVYDYNLSQYLVDGLDDGFIAARELFFNEYVEKTENCSYIINPAGMVFGPKLAIDEGIYTVAYCGDNLGALALDVYSEAVGMLEMKLISESEHELVYEIAVPCDLTDIEFREFNYGNETVVFDAILISKKDVTGE